MAKLIRDAIMKIIEDEEDIREGLKALSEEEGTITWKQYQQSKWEQESQGELCSQD